jgi:hypothetical protein
LGIVDTHPAVFVRVANTGVTGYAKRKSAEVIENKEGKNEEAKDKDNAETQRSQRVCGEEAIESTMYYNMGLVHVK